MNLPLNNFFKSIKNKKIAFCGIGSSNLPLIKQFVKKGAKVIACDMKSYNELGENAKIAEKAGATLSLGENYLKNLNNLNIDILFRTPGMKYFSEELTNLKNSGVVITSEMELFFEYCPCKIIAVTGSDGKTTTTTIISELLKEEGYNVHLGGNIGRPLFSDIEKIKPDDYAVVELSSFQLISMRQSPDIAVITNITPNHLDIHKNMKEYIDAKKNILLHQNAFSKSVLNLNNKETNDLSLDVRGNLVKFSRLDKVQNGTYVENNIIIYNEFGKKTNVINVNDIKIPGTHNVENFIAAISAVWGLVSIKTIKNVANTFSGVEHRAEFVRTVNNIKYYNDSIASSPTRTASGTLSLYDNKIILIAGGYDKNLNYDDLGDLICKKVKSLILMGDTGEKIKKSVKNSKNYNESLKIYIVKNMEEAVELTEKIGKDGDIVSMSPASASFDLYNNFVERGNHFKELVNKL